MRTYCTDCGNAFDAKQEGERRCEPCARSLEDPPHPAGAPQHTAPQARDPKPARKRKQKTGPPKPGPRGEYRSPMRTGSQGRAEYRSPMEGPVRSQSEYRSPMGGPHRGESFATGNPDEYRSPMTGGGPDAGFQHPGRPRRYTGDVNEYRSPMSSGRTFQGPQKPAAASDEPLAPEDEDD